MAPCKMNADMVATLDFCIDLDTHSRLITAQIVPFLWHWKVVEAVWKIQKDTVEN